MVTTRRGKRKSMDAFPVVEPQEMPSSASSASKRQKLPLRKKRTSAAADMALELDAALQEDVATQTLLPTPVVKREVVGPAPAAEDGDEEDDSDDEAPEAVSNVQAASKAREAAEAMMKAAKEETDKLRQKRKERDARLKEQAQSRKAKQETQPEPQPEAQDPAAEAAAPSSPAEPTPRFGRVEIPTLLPAEFLDSDSEAEAEDGDEQTPKRRKAEVQRIREPRDKRVGDAVYRVMRQTDARMAPKGEGRSKRVRTGLVKRGREGARKASGFLVGGKRRVDWGTSRR